MQYTLFSQTNIAIFDIKILSLQVTFFNFIATIKGGTHVNSAITQMTTHLMDIVNERPKKFNVKAHVVKNHVWIFVNALIHNPDFDSQTKENLTTRPRNFGSKCELSSDFLGKGMCTLVMSQFVCLWHIMIFVSQWQRRLY